jgi:hypothetical protein
MFPFPPEPPSPASRAAPGITPSEKGKVVLLGVAFLFVLGLMVFFYVFSTSGSVAPPAPPEGAPGVPVPGPSLEFQPVPLFPAEEAAEIEGILREKLKDAPPPGDGVAAVDPAVHEVLLDAATLDARVLNLLPEGFDRDPGFERILADPGAFRGKCVSAAGELLSLDRVPYEGKNPTVKELRRGLLRDAAGRHVTFTWPVSTPLEPDPVAPGSGWARVFGLFYKTWPVPDPKDPSRTVPSLHLVLSRRPRPDYPLAKVTDIDPAWMEQVRDEKPSEMLSMEEDPLFLLLNLVGNLGPQGFEGWLKGRQETLPPGAPRVWPPEEMSGRTKELLANPGLWRFRPVRSTGLLARPTELDAARIRPNPGNVEKLWIGILVDVDFVPGVWIVSPRSFVDQGLKAQDRVQVEGFFYKRFAYQPAGKGPMNQAAVIVAGRIRAAPLPPRGIATGLLIGIVGLMVALAGGLVWVLLQGRREDAASQARRREKAERKRRKAGGGADGEPPPPAAPPPPPGGAAP